MEQISTLRLKPIVHSSKNCVLTLKEDGEILLQTPQNEELFLISKDGSEFMVLDSDYQAIACYTFSELPYKYEKIYKYAYKFIEVLKSKTPKVFFQIILNSEINK